MFQGDFKKKEDAVEGYQLRPFFLRCETYARVNIRNYLIFKLPQVVGSLPAASTDVPNSKLDL